MIYQLMKLDPARKYVPWMALLSAAAGLLAAASGGAVAFAIGFPCALFALSCLGHATDFEASLPIAGRQVFAARVTLTVAMLWLPAIAGGGAMLLSGGFVYPALALAEIAGLCTLAIMVLQLLRLRAPGGPKWLGPALLIPVLAAWANSQLFLSNTEIPTLAVCLPLAAALFLWAWRTAPESVQLAPAVAAGGAVAIVRAQAKSGTPPAIVWLPILRSVFTPWHAFLLPYMFYEAGGSDVLMWCFWLNIVWRVPRQRLRWARALPLGPRVVLRVILAPVLLALAGGYFLGVHAPALFTFARYSLRPQTTMPEPRDQILDLAAVGAWVLLVVLFHALVDWRRLRHLPAVVRRYLMMVPMAAAFSVVIPLRGTWGIDVIRDALVRLSRALPGNLAAMIGITIIPLAALYWLVQRVFEEGEYTDRMWEGKDGWTIPNMWNRDSAIR